MTLVKEVMTAGPTTVGASASLQEAARLMRDGDFGALPVLEGEKLIGVITDRDLVTRGLADGSGQCVGDICSRDVRTIDAGDSDESARRTMEQAGVRRLPVQEGGRIVGMLSVGDLAVRSRPELAGSVMEKTGPEERGGRAVQATQSPRA